MLEQPARWLQGFGSVDPREVSLDMNRTTQIRLERLEEAHLQSATPHRVLSSCPLPDEPASHAVILEWLDEDLPDLRPERVGGSYVEERSVVFPIIAGIIAIVAAVTIPSGRRAIRLRRPTWFSEDLTKFRQSTTFSALNAIEALKAKATRSS
jgi:hypothetical protein